jgi:sigma-E factor negative regulatory protein RseC
MIEESGKVVAVDTDCLWVEAVQKSTCGSCSSRNGCGQRLLAQLTGKSNQIRVPLDQKNTHSFQIGESVQIGIPEYVLINGALAIYVVPLLALIFGAWLGDAFYSTEVASIICALVGFIVAGLAIRLYGVFFRNDPRFSPVLIG